jgi:zinc protease
LKTDYAVERYRIVEKPDEIVSVLQNGLTVITRRVESPAVAVRGYTYTGGVFEGKWLGGGLSHLLEHLVAGGSNGRRTERQNIDLLMSIGNNSNAYTTDDHTSFYVDTTKAHMEEAVDLVTGWMLTAAITPEEYRREYQVVQRELEMGKGSPDTQFAYLTQFNRYRVSPARVPVIGYQEVIQGLSRDDVYTYYRLAYQPNNLVFVVTGDYPPEEMLRAVQQHVGDAPPGREFSRDIPDEPPVLAPRTVVATFPKLGQAKLELAFPSVRLQHPDLFALDLLAAILGESESSILVEEIRDKQQLVSGISVADNTPSYVAGSFMIDMELDADKVPQATKAVLDALEKVKQSTIEQDRIDRAKTLLRASHVKSLQTADAIAAELATSFMFTGDPHFQDRYIEEIEKVTPAELQRVAKEYLDPAKLVTTAMLPTEFVGAAGYLKAEELLRAAAPTTKPTTTAPGSDVVTRVELNNGITLLHKRIATSPLVVMTMSSLGGVSAEDAKTNGIGNLTMELLPRGTKTRSAQQIASFFDSIGGDLNTSCSTNTWTWSANCMKGDFDRAFEVFADVIQNPAFPQTEIDPMKQRVLGAIDGQDADWFQQAYRFFKQQYYGPKNSPYQFTSLGTKENVQKLTAEQLQQWYSTKVFAGKRVLVVYGDVTLDEARAVVEKQFGPGQVKSGTWTLPLDVDRSARKVQGALINVERVETQKTEQALAGIAIGFDSMSIVGDPWRPALDVADTLCSGYGYPGGYLFDTLRGRGLVYTVDAQNVPGRDPKLAGTFVVTAGCDPEKVNECVDLILLNVARLQGSEKDIQPDWFARAKQLIAAFDAISHETPAAQAEQAASDELFDLGYAFHADFLNRISSVYLTDVQTVARNRLRRCVVTVSTPRPELVKIPTGERKYESFPPVELTPKGVQHDAGGASAK